MLRITVLEEMQTLTLVLEGRLTKLWLHALEECWQRAFVHRSKSTLRVDLTGVTFIDDAGKALLATMQRHGAELLAADCMTKAIVSEITQASAHEKVARSIENQGNFHS